MAAVVSLCFILGACESTAPKPDFAQPVNRPPDAAIVDEVNPAFATYNPSASTVFPDYRLNIGDELEVIFHVRTGVSAEKYRLKVQDAVSIRFPFQETLDQEVTVQSDGTIRLLLVGEVLVVERGHRGISPFHFRQQLEDETWLRFDPATETWVPYPFLLLRSPDGVWWKQDPQEGTKVRLDQELPVDGLGRLVYPCIIDAKGRAGRSDRFEYDQVQQLWKTRATIVEQKGLTAKELEDVLRTQYAKYLKEPELTVKIQQANIKIEELKKAITTAPRGQSRLMPIKPDGTVDLPFVGEVLAYGKTVQQLKTDVETAYAQVDLPEIAVTVQINSWAAQKVFVLGEVKAPGMLRLPTSATVLQAIAAAGGVNERAAEHDVLVVRRKGLPVPEATLVDLVSLVGRRTPDKAGEVPDFANMRFDFYLTDGDIIYVPTTVLATAGDWTEQVFARIVRNVVPYNFYVGLNYGYELHREPGRTETNYQDLFWQRLSQ